MIGVKISNSDRLIEASQGENLLTCLQEHGIPIAAECGGRAGCGKCLVKIVPYSRIDDGRIEGISHDVMHKLEETSFELACKFEIVEDICVFVPVPGKGDIVLTEGVIHDPIAERGHVEPSADCTAKSNQGEREELSPVAGCGGADQYNTDRTYGIAVDLGTTTVAIRLLDIGDGGIVASAGFANPQRAYGADVMSRISVSEEDATELSSLIRSKVDAEIMTLLTTAGVHEHSILRVVIAGNTAMTYILLGFRCISLAKAPFLPEYIFKEKYNYAEIFSSDRLDCECLIYPFASSFVGGDVIAGMVYIEQRLRRNASDANGSYMLMDLGTNGEIVYRTAGNTIMTSAAAGPALEGGNISSGMSAVEGAIYSVRRMLGAGDLREEGGTYMVDVIGQTKAKGLCGSGVIDLIACMLRDGTLLRSGRYSSIVDDNSVMVAEEITFSQSDIREFQLAKGAIRAGAEVLIKENADILPKTVYIAGGFGINLNLENAAEVGLLPEVSINDVIYIGNSSVEGAALACQRPELMEDARIICNEALTFNLAEHADFEEKFIENMSF